MAVRTRALVVLVAVMLVAAGATAQTPVINATVPATSFVGEPFCFTATLTNVGAPGYGPYLRLVLPPGITFSLASWLGSGITSVFVGTFPAIAPFELTDPLTGTVVTGVAGGTYYNLIPPIGSVTAGQPPIDLEICAAIGTDSSLVGVPQPITMTPVYRFGDTPTGVNGPVVGAPLTQSVTPTVILFDKANSAPEGERPPGPSWPITYTLSANVANAQTVFALRFRDTLPASLQYDGNLVITGGTGCVATTTPSLVTPGGLLQVDCASVLGTLAAGEVVVTYQAHITDILDEANCSTQVVTNAATLDAEFPAGTSLPQLSDSSQVTAKHVAIQKGVAPGAASPGATVSYAVAIQVTDYGTVDALVLTDVMADGLTYVGVTSLVVGGTSYPIAPTVQLDIPGPGQTTVTYDIRSAVGANIGPGSDGALTYTATVDQAYASGEPVLTRDTLPNAIGGVYGLTAGAAGCSEGSGAAVSIIPIVITKSIVAPQPEYAPGDVVTFLLTMGLPSGDADAVVFEDFLPLPVFDATTVSLTYGTDIRRAAPPDTMNLTPVSITASAATNSIRIEWGDVSTTEPQVIAVYLDVVVTDEPFADDLFLTNLFQVSTNNSTPQTASGLTPIGIHVRASALELTKGVLSSNNPGTVINPPPASQPVNGNATNGDAGDILTYRITAENTGGAQAFDVTIVDTVPAGLGSCSLVSVTDGAGNPLASSGDPFGAGLLLANPLAASDGTPGPPYGADTALVTVQCTVLPTVNPRQVITNTASVTWASQPGATAFPALTDTASLTIADPAVAKTLIGTEIVSATNGAAQAVIGELVSYRLTLTIPEGVTPAVQVVDTLDTGLAFVDVVSVSSSPGVSMATPIGTGAAPANVSIGPPGVGNVVTFNPGAITNTNSSAAAETIVVEYRAVVLNVAGNQAGALLDNSAVLSFTGGSLAAASAAPVTVIEPTLTLTKAAAPASGDANDPITFTITVTSGNGAANTDAFDLSLTDVVPAGMTYVAGSLASPGGTAPAPVLSDAAAPTLTATWAGFPRNANRTITFQATIDGTAFPGQTITNSVNLTWTSLPGSPGTRSTYNASSTERTGAGGVNDYTGTATRNVTVTGVAPQKSIVASSEAHTTGNSLAVGEIVRFRLVLQLPETTVQHLQLRDILPAGLTFLDDGTARAKFVGDGNVSSAAFDGPAANDAPAVPCANLAGSFTLAQAASTASIPSAAVDCTLADLNISRLETSEDDAYGSGGTVFFKLGTVTNADNEIPATNNNEFVIVELNALVDNSAAGSNDGGDTRTNALRARRWTGSAMDNLGGSVNAPVLTVREPAIPFNGTANNKTVSPTTGDAGDTVTYTVTFTNQNTAATTTAFEVRLLDTLPAAVALNLGSVAVNLGACATGLTNASAGNTVDVALASVPAGCTVTTTYQAVIQDTVNPGQLVTNTASLAHTSLPGPLGTCPNDTASCVNGAPGTAGGERDGSGGINDYAGTDQATFTVLSPGFTKAGVASSEPTTGAAQGNPAVTDLTVGETVTFRMRTVLPEGTTPIVTITDNLPFAPGVLGVVSAAVTWVGANLIPANSPALVTVSDVQLGDGIDDRVVFDFGQVFNTPDGTANASDEIEVEVVAVVVNVPANGAGDLLTNSAVLAYGGGLQASATADVELVEPALNVAKSAAPATGDAGDVITYTMTVEQLPASTADAFDVVVTDTLPANTIWIGNVTPVSGTAPTVDAASFPVVTFSWAQIPESDGPYVFTYQVQLTNAVQPGDVLSNSAVAVWNTLPGSDPNERGYSDTASSSVTVTQPGVTKAVVDVAADTTVAETGTAVNGSEPDLTIGEQVAYTVTLTLIEGTTSNAVVVDDLPVAPGILEVVSSEVISFGANVSGTGLQPGQAGVPSDRNADARNDRVTFSLGILTNFPDGISNADDWVVLRVVAVVPDLPANQGGLDNLTNTAAFSFAGGGPLLGAADVDLVAPLLNVTKTNLVPYGDAGDTITYEVTVAHTGASTADAFELTLVDALPPGQTYVGLQPVGGDPLPVEDLTGLPGTVVFSYATLPLASGSYTFRYQVTLDIGVQPGATYQNTISGSWTSLPPGVPGDGGPNDRIGSASDSADVTINAPALVKVATATSLGDTGSAYFAPGDFDLAVGERVTYVVTVTFPEGTTSAAVVTDRLQADAAGVLEAVAARIISVGSNITTTLPGTPVFSDAQLGDGRADTVTFALGTVTNTPDGVVDDDDRATFEVEGQVVNVATNTNADSLLNLASLTYASGPPLADDASVDVVEPQLGITKTMGPVVSGAVTMTVTLANTGTAPAYDLIITDVLAASTWSTATITPLAVPPGFILSAAGAPGDATVTMASDPGAPPPASSLEPGEAVIFSFSVQLVGGSQPPSPVTNTATNTVATSLPGADPEERDQPDVSDSDTLVLPSLDALKGAALLVDADLSGTVSPGDTLRYTIAVVNSGASPATDVVVDDAPDAGAALVVGSVVPSAGGLVILGNTPGDTTVRVSFAAIAAGETATLFYDVLIPTPAPAGLVQLVNQAVVASNELPPLPSDDPANGVGDDNPTVVPVFAAPDIAVAKTDGVVQTTPGATLTYTITVTNLGNQNATGVTLIDTIPTGTTFVAASDGGTETAPGSGIVTWPQFPLAVGVANAVTRTVTVLVTNPPAPAQSTLVNTVQAADDGSNGADPDPGNNTATDVDTLIQADVAVVKTDSPDPVVAGTSLTYGLNVTNNGPSPATGVTVVDELPAGVTFVSASPGCVFTAPSTVTCAVGNLAVGATVPLSIVVAIPADFAPGSITNQAVVSAAEVDAVPGNNLDTEPTAVIAETDLAIVKTDAPDPVVAGQNLTWTLQVTNNGVSSSTGSTVVDTLPAGVSFVSASPGCVFTAPSTVTCAVGPLAVSASTTISIVVGVGSGTSGPLANTATVTGNETDPDPTDNTATSVTTVTRLVDLSVVKTGPPIVSAGQQLTFSLLVVNAGPSDATAVSLADPTPVGLSFVSASAPCAAGFPCVLGDLAAGSSVTVTVTFQVPPGYTAPDPITNTATVSGIETDTDPGNNTSTATTALGQAADLSITKDDGVVSVLPGTSTTYTITVVNAGPSDAVGATVSDVFPTEITSATWTCVASAGSSCTAGPVVGDINDIVTVLAGGNLVYTVVAEIDPAATGDLVNTAVVAPPAGISDPNPGDNQSTDIDSLGGSTNLSVVKTDEPDPVVAGETLTYTLLVSNGGPSASTGGEVIDTLPSALTFISASSGCVFTAPSTVTCSFGPLAAGDSTTFTITCDVDLWATGPLSNTAVVAGNEGDPDPDDNTDSEPTTVLRPPIEIPTLGAFGQLLLILLLTTAGILVLRQRMV